MLDQDDNFYLRDTMQTTPFSCWFFFHFFLVVFICEIKWLRDNYMHLRFLVYELKQYLYIMLLVDFRYALVSSIPRVMFVRIPNVLHNTKERHTR